MHDKLFFSLAIELSHCSKHTKFTIFLSYQASLAYNPKEFLGVITNCLHCWGEEIEAQLPWEMTLDLALMIDKAWTSIGCNHLYGDSMKDEFNGDSIVQKSVGDSTGMT
jgi:hypothetical protein